jgi:transglutaminase-like putative cysteine protease
MKIIRTLVAGSLLFMALGLSAPAQTAVEKELRAASERLARCSAAKDWEGALNAIDRLMELAESFPDPGVKARTLYNKACVLALAGRPGEAVEAVRSAVAAGYIDYDRFETDADFDPIRTDPGFRSIVADLKAKHAPRPLPWDREAGAPEFSQIFDPVGLPELRDMRREFALDEVVAGAKNDYDRLKRLASWVSARWKHSPDQMASKGDPVTILREAKAGGRFICRDYAIVLAGVARAYGMPARVLNLLPKDVETRSESHSVAEVWLEGFGKWVLADGQFGAIGELDGTPLSGLELQAAFAADKPVICAVGAPICAEWRPFILRNAFYFKTGDDQRLFERKIERQLVLVPKGAPHPHKFAGGNESVFAGSVYTSNPDSFYAPPAGRTSAGPAPCAAGRPEPGTETGPGPG